MRYAGWHSPPSSANIQQGRHVSQPSWELVVKQQARGKLLQFSIGLVISLGLAEVLLRALSVVTPDGAVFLFRAPCPPLQVPVAQVEEALRRYESDPGLVIQYDAQLGWSPRPGGVSADGMYRYAQDGSRVGPDSKPTGKTGQTVALFGDSTMHGTGVPWQDSIGARLSASGVYNVKNFALGAYGMDQALLRWRAVQDEAKPSFVVFGFQAENVKRNGSIFRSFYTYETVDIPFSKPRFELAGASLEPVNLPTLPVAEIVPVLRNFGSSPLRNHDYFYQPELYRDSFLFRSRLVAFALGAVLMNNQYVVAAKERATYSPDGELGALALAIMRRFREEVERSGARFVVVHLPRRVAVEAASKGSSAAYEQLLSAVRSEFGLIDPLPLMAEVAREQGVGELYVDPWHYSGEGAQVVAEALSRELQ